MLENGPLVSIIMPFYNTNPLFMREAIDSVLSQTYPTWELLLIDDGSDEESVSVANNYIERYSKKIRYLCHTEHKNLGASSSRQLGIYHAKGKYIALLDADDVWLPVKLEQQVIILEKHTTAAMLCGNTLYWYSWSDKMKDIRPDFIPALSFQVRGLIQPPKLIPLYLSGKVSIPCTCSVIFRRQQVLINNGFEEEFPDMYDDQVFYAKVCLESPIYVSDQCWDRYRQHPNSLSAVAFRNGQEPIKRLSFLKWLERYMTQKELQDREVWQALNRELWHYRQPNLFFNTNSKLKLLLWIKKWLLTIEEKLLPDLLRRYIWIKDK